MTKTCQKKDGGINNQKQLGRVLVYRVTGAFNSFGDNLMIWCPICASFLLLGLEFQVLHSETISLLKI